MFLQSFFFWQQQPNVLTVSWGSNFFHPPFAAPSRWCPPKPPPQILVPPFHSNPTNISYKETKQRIILSLLYTLHTKHTIQLFYLLSSEISSTWILNCADLLLITNRREKIEKKDLCCCVLLYFHGLHKSGGFFILGGVVKYQNGKWKSMVTRQCCQLILRLRKILRWNPFFIISIVWIKTLPIAEILTIAIIGKSTFSGQNYKKFVKFVL